MIVSLERKIGAGVILALLAALGVQSCRVARAADALRGQELRSDSLEAVNDTSRNVTAKLQKILGDTVQAIERRAVQAEIERDAIDRALGRTTQANIALVAVVDRLSARVTSTGPITETPEGLRSATYHLRKEPWTLDATAKIPRPDAGEPATLDAEVAIDSAAIGVRVQCGSPPANSHIRPATVLVTTPPWLKASIGAPQTDDEVCNPLPPKLRWWEDRFSLGGQVGFGYTPEGWQPYVGVGGSINIWSGPRRRR